MKSDAADPAKLSVIGPKGIHLCGLLCHYGGHKGAMDAES